MSELIDEKIITDSIVIATRELEYCRNGSNERSSLLISIRSPVFLTSDHNVDPIDIGSYCSVVQFSSLIPDHKSIGADALQALTFAINVDDVLRFFSRRQYTFYRPGSCNDYLDPTVFNKFYSDFRESRLKEKDHRLAL